MAMTYGIHLPQYGRVAGGDAVSRAARHAEDLGFRDVWVSDHIVHPAEQTYPSPFLLDPFATLSWAAAVTTRKAETSRSMRPCRSRVSSRKAARASAASAASSTVGIADCGGAATTL